MLPIVTAATLLVVTGAWWILAVVAWWAWERRFQSPALRQRLAQSGETSGFDVADIVIFGLPMVVAILLGLDGLVPGPRLLYVPAWTVPIPLAALLQGVGAAFLFIGLPLFTAGAYLTGKYVYSQIPEGRTLLARGPYRYIRHPIYLSFVLIGIGFVFLSQNYLALLCLSLLVNTKGWTQEEAHLADLYGEAYREYRDRTGAFFPRLWKRK